jgi:hypothetical protein
MSSIPALQSAVTGIMRGMSGLRNNATAVADATMQGINSPTDLTKPLIEAIGNQRQAEAAVKIVKAADSMLGTLIDLHG